MIIYLHTFPRDTITEPLMENITQLHGVKITKIKHTIIENQAGKGPQGSSGPPFLGKKKSPQDIVEALKRCGKLERALILRA